MTYAECSEDEHINPKEERDCDKQDEDVQEEGDTSKILTLKKLRSFTTLKVQRIKCWKPIQT